MAAEHIGQPTRSGLDDVTDARLRGEWLTAPAHDSLSDKAYRVLHNALMYCAEHGTDGALADRELRFLYPGVLDQATLDELEHAGFWARVDGGYRFIDWNGALGQSTAAEVNAYRKAHRDRQQRYRDRKAAERAAVAPTAPADPPDEETTAGEDPHALTAGNVTRHVTRHVTPNVGKARLGEARPSPSLANPPSTTPTRAPASARDDAEATRESVPRELEYPAQCVRHQDGRHSAPCFDCGEARKAHARTQRATRRSRSAPQYRTVDGRRICNDRPHNPTADGTCRNCEIRAEDLAAELLGAIA